MCVGRADHAELVGIHAEFCFQLHAANQARPDIAAFHVLELATIEEVLVALEVGELVARGQQRVRFRIALVLGHFLHGLPARAQPRVFLVDGTIVLVDQREETAVGQVRVMADSDEIRTDFLGRLREPVVQVARLLRVVETERQVLNGLVLAIGREDDAVQVSPFGQ